MVDSSEFQHLGPEARKHAEEANEARIRRIRSDRWISFPHAETVLAKMSQMLAQPRKARMPCLLVTASSGMGKTMIATRFLRDHPPTLDEKTGIASTPVVAIQMTDVTSPRRLYTRLLDALGAPMGKHQHLDLIETVTTQLMRNVGVRLLIIDEVQDILVGSARQQRFCLNLLKLLTNQLQLSIVTFGVQDAAIAMAVDAQIESRFPRMDIPEWREGEQFRGVLVALERSLPLRRPSKLNTAIVARYLLRESRGITGSIVNMVADAAVFAIESEQECVTESVLRESFEKGRLLHIPPQSRGNE